MRNLLLFISCLFTINIFGQVGYSFSEAKASGITLQHLDSLYERAIDSDSKEDYYIDAWTKMFQALKDTLVKENFTWVSPTTAFNRVCFQKNGSIDYFLYKFKTDIDPSKVMEFNAILNRFIKTYRFPKTKNKNFFYTGNIDYFDAKGN
jgi:hypothetical protein